MTKAILNTNIKLIENAGNTERHQCFKTRDKNDNKVIIELGATYIEKMDKKTLPYIWYKKGYTKTLLHNYITIGVYVYTKDGCHGMYNPQIYKNKCEINFKYLLEDTKENRIYLLNKVYQLANK